MSGISDKNLNAEIELLKRALAEKQDENIVIFDRKIELEESVLAWQEKFQRLYESHKKTQNINQNLEEKLLRLVDKNATERAKMTRNCATMNIRLNQANFSILHLQREIERYKRDIALAIHLLRCNPKGFLSPNIKSFPTDLQSKISKYADSESIENDNPNTLFKGKYQSIPTFESPDKEHNVSPIAVSKFLEDEVSEVKHCDTCCCASLARRYTNSGVQSKSNKNDYFKFENRNLSSPTSFNSLPFESNSQGIDQKKNSVFNNQNFVHHKMCERVSGGNNQKNSNLSVKQKKNIVPAENKKEVVPKKQLSDSTTRELKPENKVPKKINTQDENGKKSCEAYNKNLLEYIKNKNLKKDGPRVCALRIHDDGIYIDSTHDEIFIRKKTLIDFDAFDKYESISPLIISSIASTIDEHIDDEIFSVNKTDSEKFNEIKSQSNAHGYSTSEANFTEQNQSQNENAVMKHQRITEWINSSINAPLQSDNINVMESSSDFNDNNKSNESNMSLHSETSPEHDKDKMDLLQMEYNVKQFLLKQNEWSVYRELDYNETFNLPTRTETNL